MSQKLYFIANVDGVNDLFRVNADDEVARVTLPEGISALGLRQIAGDAPFFAGRDADGKTALLRLDASGPLVRLSDSNGTPLFADNADQATVEGNAVYFNGTLNGVHAI